MSTQRERRPGEIAFTIALLAGSLFMLWQAYGISRFESITSAGVFPMIATLTMVVTGGLILRHSLRSPLAPDASGRTPVQRFAHELTPAAIVTFTAAIAVYMGLLERLGFVASSYLFLVIGMRLLGSRRWGLNLLVSALALAAIYLVFRTAFSVVLPAGTWLRGWLQ